MRELLSYLPQNSFEEPPAAPPHVVDRSEEIESIVPDNLRRAYDVRRVIEALTDEGSFLEIQAEFARNGVIGLARMEGRVIGIVANQPTHMVRWTATARIRWRGLCASATRFPFRC